MGTTILPGGDGDPVSTLLIGAPWWRVGAGGSRAVAEDDGVGWLVDPAGERPDTLLHIDAPRTVRGFRFASIVDGVDGTGEPVVSAERGWVEDPAERARLLNYLRGGAPVFETTRHGSDYFDPTRRFAVPAGYRTDGRWLWQESVAYYLEQHGVGVEPELAKRIADFGYRCPPVTEEMVVAAYEALRERVTIVAELVRQARAASPVDEERFPPDVSAVLTRFGWAPGRDASGQVEPWLTELLDEEPFLAEQPEPLAAARRALHEFGGLAFPLHGPGRELALSPFWFYPAAELPDPYDFGYLGNQLGVDLFPIGRVGDGRYDLVIDGTGRVFMAGDVDFFLGADLDEALVRLVEGRLAPRARQVGP
jgi:hypothetical protein